MIVFLIPAVDSLSSDDLPALVGASEFSVDSEQQQQQQQQQPMNLPALLPIEDGMGGQVPVKKKRGRPKKIRADGTTAPTPVKQSSVSAATSSSSTAMNGADFVNGQPPKKKRGRPKKIRTDEVRPVPQMMDANGGLSNSFGGGGGSSSSNHSHLETNRGPHSPAPSSYSSMAGHSFVNNQPSVINHPSSSSSASSQQQHSHALDYYGRASSNVGGGPLSGLCNDMSPHQSTSSTPQPATSSPRQLEFDPG
jgi:hypothetical protein